MTNQQGKILAKAYSRAPDYVKAKLCRLTQLFVTGSTMGGPMGWGFWEAPDRSATLGVYVAISGPSWGPRTLSSKQRTKSFGMLLQVSARPRAKDTWAKEGGWWACKLPTRGSGTWRFWPSSPTNWATPCLPTPMRMVPTRNIRDEGGRPSTERCFEDAFIGASWNAKRFRRHMRRWVDFGEQNQNRQKNPDVRFSLNRLRTVAHGKFDAVNDVIRKVYRSREFVSLPASVSPGRT